MLAGSIVLGTVDERSVVAGPLFRGLLLRSLQLGIPLLRSIFLLDPFLRSLLLRSPMLRGLLCWSIIMVFSVACSTVTGSNVLESTL